MAVQCCVDEKRGICFWSFYTLHIGCAYLGNGRFFGENRTNQIAIQLS